MTQFAARIPGRAMCLRILLVIAIGLLILGLTAPIITMTKLVFFENTFSVFSGVMQLLAEGKIFLFVVITAFSIVIPFLKIIMLFLILTNSGSIKTSLKKHLYWMHQFGKWSMLDVFIVAVLVVSVKMGAIVNVEMRYGLYAFAASVVLIMFVTAGTVSLTNKLFVEDQGKDSVS